MKITIYSPEPPFTRDAHICVNGSTKRLQNSNAGIRQSEFDEDEICFLIGEKEFKKYQDEKVEFDIPKWKLDVVEGCFNPKTREHLIFSSKWNNRYFD